MPGLVEIWSVFSKPNKMQDTASSSSLGSAWGRQGGEEKGKILPDKARGSVSTLSESEVTICMLLMDRFAPS